jgi:hypothetical protein
VYTPLFFAVLAIFLALVAGPAGRIVWVRRQIRRTRLTLVSVHGLPADDEMNAELKKAAVRLSPRLGRFVRVDNLDKSRV